MAVFTSTDLNRRAGDIIEEARRGPVTITQRRRPAFVLMSYDAYRRLSQAADTRKSYTIDTLPDELWDKAEAAYRALATRGDEGDE